MKLLQAVGSLLTRDLEAHAEAGRAALVDHRPRLARWHLDQLVAQAPQRARAAGDCCAAMEQPALAKRYYKRAIFHTAHTAGPVPASLRWELGRQYMALSAQATGERAQALRHKGMDAFARAEADAPEAYGPHASRLRGLLDQCAERLFALSWTQALSRGFGTLTVVGQPDEALVCELLRELVASQRLLPHGDELLAVGQLFVLQLTPEVQAEVSTRLLPLLNDLLLRPECDEALACGALGVLAYAAAALPGAALPVADILGAYGRQGRLTLGTLDAFLTAYSCVANTPTRVEPTAQDLLGMVELHVGHPVASALAKRLCDGRVVQPPRFVPPLPAWGGDSLVALPAGEGWAQSSLASALSADGVLNLDKAQAACLALDEAAAAQLNAHLSSEQRRALNAVAAQAG